MPVSSTRIRTLVAQGDVVGAAALLGRPHEVRGEVVRGDGRGGPELGFPTANLAVADDIALPADGMYAGHFTRADGSVHPAAIYVGRRPTFYEPGTASVLVEAYLLNFDGDLYGEHSRVSFVDRLRGDQKFDTVDALIAQMHQDVANASSRRKACSWISKAIRKHKRSTSFWDGRVVMSACAPSARVPRPLKPKIFMGLDASSSTMRHSGSLKW